MHPESSDMDDGCCLGSPASVLEKRPASAGPTLARTFASQTIETALVLTVALLSHAHDARELFERIDFRQRRRPEEVSIVALAPTAKPTH